MNQEQPWRHSCLFVGVVVVSIVGHCLCLQFYSCLIMNNIRLVLTGIAQLDILIYDSLIQIILMWCDMILFSPNLDTSCTSQPVNTRVHYMYVR